MAYQEGEVGLLRETKLTANDSTAQTTLGSIRELNDGRKFRYVKMTGGALAQGKLVRPAAVTAITNLTSATGIGPDGANTTIITDADGAMTTDAYIGYYFKVDTGMTGSTEAIKVVANTATTLTLEKSIGIALTAAGTDDGELIPPKGVVRITAVTTPSQNTAGVGIGTITENYYGWVQFRGEGNVICSSAVTEGYPITPGGASVTGQAMVATAIGTDEVIGYVRAAAGTNEMALVDLVIA